MAKRTAKRKYEAYDHVLVNALPYALQLDLPDCLGTHSPLPVTIVARETGIEIQAEGYGDSSSNVGSGSPIFIEWYDGKLRVHLFGDINREDPTHSIDLEGARESARIAVK